MTGPARTSQARHAMKPTPLVLFLRTFVLYQLIRFVWINVRMMKMIWMSHRGAQDGMPRAIVSPNPSR